MKGRPDPLSTRLPTDVSLPGEQEFIADPAGAQEFVDDLRRASGQSEGPDSTAAEEARRRLSLLDQVTNLFVSSLDRELTALQFARILVPNFADWCALYLEEDGTLRQAVRRYRVEGNEPVQVVSHAPAPRRLVSRFRSGKAEVFGSLDAKNIATMTSDRSALAIGGTISAIVAPLVHRNEVRGGLILAADPRRRVYGEADLSFVVEVARRARLGFENIRLYHASQHTAQRLRLLIDVAQAASQTLDPDQVLDRVVRQVGQAFNAEFCHVRLLQPDGSIPISAIWARNHWIAERHRREVVRPEDSLVGSVIRSGRMMSSPDGHNHPDLGESVSHLVPSGSWVHLAPISGRDGPIGVLSVCGSWSRRPYVADDATLLSAVAQQLAISIVNARLYTDLRLRSERLAALVEVARAVSASLDLQSVCDIALVQIRRLIRCEAAGVYTYDPEQRQFRLVSRWTNSETMASLPDVGTIYLKDRDIIAQAARAGKPLIENAAEGDDQVVSGHDGIHAAMATPILHGSELLGGLVLLNRRSHAFDDSQKTLLEAFAAQIAVSMANARIHARLRASLDETRAAQEQLVHSERMRVIGELTSGVAHDFNNLLAAILGRVEVVLSQPNLPHQVRQDLDIVQQIGLDGAETVRRLQDLGRPRPRSPLVPVDLTRIGRDSLEITRSRWREEPRRRGIRIDVRDQLSGIPLIDGNAAELREMLTNLILNAVDAMPRGGELTLRTTRKDSWVVLEVVDTGSGIPDEVRDRIFEPFFSTKGNAGTGLGLAVVHGIVKRHDGTIAVDSGPGRGTTFQVTFPVSSAPPTPVQHGGRPPIHRVGSILVVDDNEIIAQNLGRLLQNTGHDVVTAVDGPEALEKFQARPFDLVITDLGMPILNGFDLTDRMHRERPEQPVVLMTGWGSQIEPQQAQRHGIKVVLRKPFRVDDVEEVIQEILSSSDRGQPVTPRPAASGPPEVVVRRVLVVDDDPRLGSLVCRMAEGEKLDLEWVQTPAEAFHAIERAARDVVFTDLRLGSEDGWQVVDGVRSRWPTLPLGIMTGSVEALDPDLLWHRGVDVVVSKPFRRVDFLTAIEQAIESRRSRMPLDLDEDLDRSDEKIR